MRPLFACQALLCAMFVTALPAEADTTDLLAIAKSRAYLIYSRVAEARGAAFGEAIKKQGIDAFELAPDSSSYTITVVDFKYEDVPITTTPSVLATATFNNDTDASDTHTFSDSKSTSATFSCQVTHGFTFGVSATVTAGIPVIGGSASVTPSFQMQSGETNTKQQTITQNWSWSSNVVVPARSLVSASIVLQNAQFSSRFHTKVRITGKVAWRIYYSEATKKAIKESRYPPHGDFETMSFGIGYLLGKSVLYDKVADTHLTKVDDNAVEYTIDGVFKGVEGISYRVDTKQARRN